MSSRQSRSIGIIGAGFTGSMLAVHLAELSRSALRVFMFDRTNVFGNGTAYSTPNARHLLNVRVANMSAYDSNPEHFIQWLRGNVDLPSGQTFVSRGTYGRYLRATLEAARLKAGTGTSVIEIGTEVIDVRPRDGSSELTLANGGRVEVDQVALCVGNFPPALMIDEKAMPRHIERYIANPWTVGALDGIEASDDVILIGTGLTMIDVVLDLQSRGHKGHLTALSRRGLLPVSHEETRPYRPFLSKNSLPDTITHLVRTVRREVALAAQQGLDWRSVIDALRPLTQDLWRKLPLEEKKRFLRHVRPYWEVHRHRIAPVVAAEMAELRRTNRLTTVAGRIATIASSEHQACVSIRCRHNGEARQLSGRWLINCSGPQLDYSRIEDPLIRSLFESGLARPDHLRLGLDVTDDYRLIGKTGTPSTSLFALGPPIRGSLWETTAVPDIRKQCEALARRLVSPHAG
jgi:uncharacterized NAD(P)/FAD-binding protein YdhS